MCLVGVVVRRYIDFLILLIPTPLVSALFCSSIPTFCSFSNVFHSCILVGCKHRASEGVFYIGDRGCVLCQFIQPVILHTECRNVALGEYLDTCTVLCAKRSHNALLQSLLIFLVILHAIQT